MNSFINGPAMRINDFPSGTQGNVLYTTKCQESHLRDDIYVKVQSAVSWTVVRNLIFVIVLSHIINSE
jgi:hypothetical protein